MVDRERARETERGVPVRQLPPLPRSAAAIKMLPPLAGEPPCAMPSAMRISTADDQFWIAPTAVVIGKVTLGKNASVWWHSVLRGDDEPITVGEGRTSRTAASCTPIPAIRWSSATVATVAHMVTLHGCTIGDGSLIGIGAVVLTGAVIGRNCLIAARALIPEARRFRQLAGHGRARQGGARGHASTSPACAGTRSTAACSSYRRDPRGGWLMAESISAQPARLRVAAPPRRRQTAEHRAGHQPGAARVVEIEQAADQLARRIQARNRLQVGVEHSPRHRSAGRRSEGDAAGHLVGLERRRIERVRPVRFGRRCRRCRGRP